MNRPLSNRLRGERARERGELLRGANGLRCVRPSPRTPLPPAGEGTKYLWSHACH